MQALVLTISPTLVPFTPSKNFSQLTSFPAKSFASRFSPIRATAVPSDVETSVVDYSSAFSVFPVEACETVGGEACLADIYPEAKLPSTKTNLGNTSEDIDRDYFEYTNNTKTVFPAEACDDLGGEFCGTEYQRGVY